MSLWFFMALMTAAAVFAVLWPLGRGKAVASGSDVAVYRDQLTELDRDLNAGLVGATEAEAARIEISRRLLAADGRAGGSFAAPDARAGRKLAVIAALILLPVAAVATYWHLGSPALPGAPVVARQQTPLEGRPIDALVAQVEAYLANNPEDGRGWEVLAPVYLRLGRYDDAVKARRAALRLNGASAVREADLGEALVYAANGIVTADAIEAFRRAIGLDAKEHKARYFLALALEQDGKTTEAAAAYRTLLAEAPPGAGWGEVVRRALARVATGGPTQDDIAGAENLSPEERAAMVRGMVERLAARLAEDGNDPEGWLRLIRAYVVLNDPEKARAAAIDARKAANGDAAALERINALVKSLGLET
jgi:cytochrome c-type biogenesis protein CcmH